MLKVIEVLYRKYALVIKEFYLVLEIFHLIKGENLTL